MTTESWNIAGKSVASAVGVLRAVCKEVPHAAIVLGSGVNVLLDLHDPVVLPFEELFGIAPTVLGHAGSLTIGRLTTSKDSPLVAVMRGRFHLYEGHDWSVVTLPTRTIVEWGVPRLVLTNAAGGLNRSFVVGDLMVLKSYRDHLNPKWSETGSIPALMADAQDCTNALTEQILSIGEALHKQDQNFRRLQSGLYAGLLGPSYETLAEIEMLRRLKADAVGMSTVPELLTAKGTNTMVAAISVITNVWNDQPMHGHEEVLEASRHASLRLDKLMQAMLTQI